MWKLTALARSLVVLFSLTALVYGGGALVASPRAAALCCNSGEECVGEEVCCDTESTGTGADCSGAAPNYCQTACVPSGL